MNLVKNRNEGALKGEEQKGAVYSVPGMNCEEVYIEETKKKLQDILEQQKDKVRLKR